MLARVARLPSGAWPRPRDRAQDILFPPARDVISRARIPPELRGEWVLIQPRNPGPAALSLSAGEQHPALTEVLLGTRQIVFVPGQARWFCLQQFTSADLPILRCTGLSRTRAMLSGCARHPFAAAAALARVALRGPPRPLFAARTELARVITTGIRRPGYAWWCALFDKAISAPPPVNLPRITALVVHDGTSRHALVR